MVFSRRQFGSNWNPLNQLQSEMNRLFQRWTEDATSGASASFPPLNAWEEGEQLFVTAELPGLAMSDLEIYVTDNRQLTIKGERKRHVPEKSVRHREERGFGKFSRTLEMPFAVDSDKVEAKFENGILYLKLAKHESAKPRKIQVQGE
jgi:HSP20 family protein